MWGAPRGVGVWVCIGAGQRQGVKAAAAPSQRWQAAMLNARHSIGGAPRAPFTKCWRAAPPDVTGPEPPCPNNVMGSRWCSSNLCAEAGIAWLLARPSPFHIHETEIRGIFPLVRPCVDPGLSPPLGPAEHASHASRRPSRGAKRVRRGVAFVVVGACTTHTNGAYPL